MDTAGYMVHIFYPYDFPDKVSGSLTEVIVNFGTESLISIQVDVIKSSAAMKALPIGRVSFAFRSVAIYLSEHKIDEKLLYYYF